MSQEGVLIVFTSMVILAFVGIFHYSRWLKKEMENREIHYDDM